MLRAVFPLVVVPVVLPGVTTGQCASRATAVLTPSTGVQGDLFGHNLALDGNLAIGSSLIHSNGEGAAWIFQRGASGWTEVAALRSSQPTSSGNFGSALAMDGLTVVIGEEGGLQTCGQRNGVANVFEPNGSGQWILKARLESPCSSKNDKFGHSVDISVDTIVVGEPDDGWLQPYGTAYVFERNAGGPNAWGQVAELTPSSTGSRFGTSVAVDGDTILVGRPVSDEVVVFERDLGGPGAWGERAILKGVPGDYFGVAVAIEGDTAVIGADHEIGPLAKGRAFVFERHLGGMNAWGQAVELEPSISITGDRFGESLEISGDLVAAGSSLTEGLAPGTGAVFVFGRDHAAPGAWGELCRLPGPSEFTGFASEVSLDGSTLLVGEPSATVSGLYSGRATVFEGLGLPAPEAYCTPGTSASGCLATLSASGVASATSPSGFTLSAATVEGDKDGLCFFGSNGRQGNPWGNGTSYQCVVPPVKRAGLLMGTGTSGQCDGTFLQDLNALWCPTCPKPQKNPGAGAVVQAQLWYRDPLNTSNQTTSLSDAIEFWVLP